MKNKPLLSVSRIWSMSLGFLGIQFGFALQNANASRILQNFGADIEHLSWFWLAAPITGLLVQPIVGYYSDRTWGRLGRRRPYFLFGAIFAAIALLLMPNAGVFALAIPPMFIGAGFLLIMDASINVSMEPFRALVGDLLPSQQRTYGYSVQSVLIGIGAVVGSGLPWMMANWFGIDAVSTEQNPVANNVTLAFYVGAAVLIITILWTVLRTKEYSPKELKSFSKEEDQVEDTHKGLLQIFSDFGSMPKTMKQLGVVQFFSWFALFSMWVFTTPAIAQHIYGMPVDGDTRSDAYNQAGNWVGIIFMVYNGVAALYALVLPKLAVITSRKMAHSISLVFGGVGMLSIYFFKDPNMLLVSMIGVGIAWASILAMPYAILAGSIPPAKMGIYMGIFNFFIVFPQIVNGIFGGPIVKWIYDSHAIYALIIAGISLFIAAITIHFVNDKDEIKHEL